MTQIVLIDARSDSLTVTWPAVPGATKYKLEFRTVDHDNFVLLSDQLTQTQTRKKNLSSDNEYIFRVAAIVDGGNETTSWVTHETPFRPISIDAESQCMPAPTTGNGGNQALFIYWTKVEGDENENMGYELQMRENIGGADWETIAPSLKGTKVRKKNLSARGGGYQFRVRPSTQNNGTSYPFSPPSNPTVPKGLSAAMKRWFQPLEEGTLVRNGQQGSLEPVPLAEVLGGKEFVLLYASAHWCPPCRKFTPMLANWYNSMGGNKRGSHNAVEVVFLSCDHDETSFQNYVKESHPWYSVAFDDDAREQLLAQIKVQGIPRLVVIHAETGKIVEDNAVGKPLDLNRWRALSK